MNELSFMLTKILEAIHIYHITPVTMKTPTPIDQVLKRPFDVKQVGKMRDKTRDFQKKITIYFEL